MEHETQNQAANEQAIQEEIEHERQNMITRLQIDSQKQKDGIWGQQLCVLIFSVIYGFFFYYFSVTPGYYGDESSCIKLKKNTYILGLVTLILCAIHASILLFAYSQKNIAILLNSEAFINVFYFIFYLVIWIMIWIAMSKGEDCGSLRTLAWVGTWFLIIGLLFMCCFLCCGGGAAAAGGLALVVAASAAADEAAREQAAQNS